MNSPFPPASVGTSIPATLVECEAVIERGLATFVEVGQALLSIREQRLYRETHATFEDYCRERWNMSRSFAHRQIEAASVASMLPMGNAPASERVARELVTLKLPERQREVWAETVEKHGPSPTAVQVRDVARGIFGEMRDKTRAFEAKHQPEQFDPRENARLAQMGGAFERLVTDLTRLGAPASVARDLPRDHTTDDFTDLARAAMAWLGSFIDAWEAKAA